MIGNKRARTESVEPKCEDEDGIEAKRAKTSLLDEPQEVVSERSKWQGKIIFDGCIGHGSILRETYGADAIFIDLDLSIWGWHKLHPCFPHGKIPIPVDCANGESHQYATTVEGFFHGMKAFENEDVSMHTMKLSGCGMSVSMFSRRTGKRRGEFLGYRPYIGSKDILHERDAREALYLPAYKYILDRFAQEQICQMRIERDRGKKIVLLTARKRPLQWDNLRSAVVHYETLLVKYLLDEYPECDDWSKPCAVCGKEV